MDISGKKNRFREILNYYEAFLKLSNDAVVVLDPKATIVDASDYFASICNKNRSEIIGLSADDLLNPFLTNSFSFKTVFKKLALNNEFKKETLIINQSEKISYFQLNATAIKSGDNLKYALCTLSDVTSLINASLNADENKRKLKTLFDNLNGFVYRCKNDENWTMEFISAAFKNVCGYEVDDIINNKNLSYNEIIFDEDRQKVWDEVQNALTSKLPFELFYRLRTKSGKIIYVEEHGVGVYDKNKQLIGLEGYIQDITLKVKEHQNLIKSESIIRAINNSVVDAIITIDENGKITSCNSAVEQIFGFKPNELITLGLSKIMSKNLQQQHAKSLSRLSGGGKPRILGKTVEVEGLHKSGKIIYLELSLNGWKMDEEQFYTAVIRDVSNKKATREELLRLSTAIEQSPNVIVITDKDGNINYANKAFTQITGYSQNEAKGQNPRILKSGEMPKEFYKEMWDTILAGKIWQSEICNRTKSGNLIWERIIIAPVLDKNNEIVNFIKLAENIDKERADRLKIQKNEEELRKFIGTTSEGFWRIDKNAKTTNVNFSLCKMLGYTNEEMYGKTPYDFVDEDNLKIFKQQISHSNSEKQRVYEISLRGKNGTNIPCLFSATSLSDENGNFNGSFAFISDLSTQKRANKIQKVLYNISNAANTEESLEKLIASIQKFVGELVDTRNFYVGLYDEETDMLNFPFYSDEKDKIDKAPAGKTLSKYVIDTGKPLLANEKTKKEFTELGLLKYVGSRSKVWLGVPLKVKNKAIGVYAVQNYENEDAYSQSDLEIMEIIADQISHSIQRKRSDDELKDALKKATESDRLKSAFLQNISHEIRTPMNGILGFTSLLASPDLNSDEIKSYVEVINESGQRLLNTLGDLMNISMLETGQVKINPSLFNINTELQNIILEYEEQAKSKSLELKSSFKLPNQEALINEDLEKIRSIMGNLVNNAIKYTAKGFVEIGYTLDDGFIKFYVRDTGKGINEDRQEAIFDRFVQAEMAKIKAHEGTGLGLSIAKSYTELLGGKIWVRSRPNFGSTFYFTIPFNKLKKSVQVEDNKNKLINKNLLKILIVEDDLVSFEFLESIVKDLASKIIHCDNGIDALKTVKQTPDLDIIFMDIKIPEMDGIKLTKEIRKFNKNLIIIAQTAYALPGDRERILNAGCNYYFAKPVETHKLRKLLKELMNS